VRSQTGYRAERAREVTLIEVSEIRSDGRQRNATGSKQAFGLMDASPANVLHGTHARLRAECPSEMKPADV